MPKQSLAHSRHTLGIVQDGLFEFVLQSEIVSLYGVCERVAPAKLSIALEAATAHRVNKEEPTVTKVGHNSILTIVGLRLFARMLWIANPDR